MKKVLLIEDDPFLVDIYATKLKESGFDIKKNQIELTEPIKDLGEYPVKIKFEHNLEVEIKVIVNREEEK